MAELLRLISGDKRNPIRTLKIAGSNSNTDNIFLRSGGFSPSSGKKTVQWSGRSTRQDGQKRIGSSRDNTHLSLTYNLVGGSAAELGYLQREITRFFEDAGLYEEEKTSTPCWLEYRWHDNLDDVPAPVFGQFSSYIRILDGGPPQWPKQLHNTGVLTSGNIEEVMCELVCEPFWKGLEQKVGTGINRLALAKDGLLMAVAVTNVIKNPSFGHATWNTGWTLSTGGFEALNETRPGYTRSLLSAAHLYNRIGSAAQYTETITLTAATYVISCYARRPDGAALTSADLQMWGQGAVQTTTFQSLGDNWYLCYATFTGVAASSTHGVQVKAGREVIVDDFQCSLASAAFSNYPSPFCAGYLLGCSWSGTAHASSSTCSSGAVEWGFTHELAGEFTLAGWFTPYYESVPTIAYLFEYLFDANNLLSVTLDTNATLDIVLTKTVGGATTTGTEAKAATFTDYGVPIHFAIVQSTTTLKMYINGTEEVSLTVNAGSAPNGTFVLNRNVARTSNVANGAFDGWRIWDRPLTAAQVSTLYTNELEIKSATGGAVIGMPLAFWTNGSDMVLDVVNDSSRDNWGVLLGVAGDVPALTEWRIQLPTSTPSRVLWLSCKATDTPFDPSLLFFDLQGTADAGSSGGEYLSVTSSVSSSGLGGAATQQLNDLRGRYQWLARVFVSTNSILMNPRYHWGATGEESKVNGDNVTIATDANFLLRDIGELSLHWDDRQEVPNTITTALRFIPTTGTATVRVDFFQLLPWPWCRVGALDTSITIVAGDLLIINDTVAYVKEADNSHKYTFEHRGAPVNVVPGKYNTIFMLQGEEGTQYDIADTGTFAIYITPRWLLPGGAVA